MQDPKQKTKNAPIREKSSTATSSYSQIMRDINELQASLENRIKKENDVDESEKRKEMQIQPKKSAQKKAGKLFTAQKMQQRGKLRQDMQKGPRQEELKADRYQLEQEEYSNERDVAMRIQMKSVK